MFDKCSASDNGRVSWEDDLRTGLSGPRPGRDAHLRFAPRPWLRNWDPADTPPDARRAGALILLYPGADGPRLVLTQRRADLPQHAGQVSLPGGRVDPGETPEAAAVREAHEEIGVDPSSIEILGALSTLWVVVSGFVVHPIVAVTRSPPVFVPCAREVAAVLEVPLGRLRSADTVQWGRRRRDRLDILCPYFAIDGPPVWGATAMMLGEFCAVLDPGFGPPPEPDPAWQDRLPILP